MSDPTDNQANRSRARFAAPGLAVGLLVSGSAAWLLVGKTWSADPPVDAAAVAANDDSAAGAPPEVPLPAERPVTFNRDIAPIVFEHCAACHRPGEAAPFRLLSYEDVRKRAAQIVDVTRTRYMPPWLPEPGYGRFRGAQRLTDAQIDLIRDWHLQGTVRGDPADLPAPPRFAEGWRMGEPDLVVRMEPYTLRAEGTDVYRNFVIPVPVPKTRFVKRVEMRPSNPVVVHHANAKTDTSGESRRLDAQDTEPGFDGMEARGHARYPGGHFLFWKPGTPPMPGREDKVWRLEPRTDLVVNMHMLPSGKPEQVGFAVGFFFTDKPPAPPPFMLLELEREHEIDIPPGMKDFVITDSFRLPVDVDVYGVYPHAHLLARDMQVYAALPDGTRRWLIWIKDWDWDWQAVYHFTDPVPLPAGSTIRMRFTYDNSTANLRNPNNPPRRVGGGNRTTDEMGQTWIQILPRTTEDVSVLSEWRARHWLRKYPTAVPPRSNLAAALMEQDRLEEALREIRRVLEASPDDVHATFNFARIMQMQGKHEGAAHGFRRYVDRVPGDAKGHYFLAIALESRQDLDGAVTHLRKAAELSPDSTQAPFRLALVLARQNKLDGAIESWRRVVQIRPDHLDAHFNLGVALAATGRSTDALEHYERVTHLDPKLAAAWSGMAWILATRPDADRRDPQRALGHARRAAGLTGDGDPHALDVLAAACAAAGRFDEAVATAERALRAATGPQWQQRAQGIRERLKLYRAGTAYVDRSLQ